LAANRPPHISWPFGGLELDMSETPAALSKKPRLPAWIAGLTLLGIAALVYVVFLVVSKPEKVDLKTLAHGAFAKLEILAPAPPQPASRFTDAAGKERTLADWRGKVVVLNLWATWCTPCQKEMPSLARLAKNAGGRVAVIPVSVDKAEDRGLAIRTLKKLSGDQLGFYSDPSYAIAFDAQTQSFPATIIYSRDGVELARLNGDADWSSPEATKLVTAALTN
jgi:thiol-disulfide isomerase/thioredoxin